MPEPGVPRGGHLDAVGEEALPEDAGELEAGEGGEGRQRGGGRDPHRIPVQVHHDHLRAPGGGGGGGGRTADPRGEGREQTKNLS